MNVDAVLILGVIVFKIISKAERRRKFASGLWIEIRIGTACIDRIVADAEIGNSGLIISARCQISGEVCHEIIDAKIPAQRGLRHQITDARDSFGETAPYSES